MSLHIDLNKIRSNIETLKVKFGQIMPLVKGNGYGTDAVQLTRFLANCGIDMVGVSYVSEAIHLREHGIELDLFVISAPFYEAESILKYNLEPSVSCLEEIQALSAAGKRFKKQVNLHLNVNTGMNRFGAYPEEVPEIENKILSDPNLYLKGVMTHFAAADKQEHAQFTNEQIEVFKHTVNRLQSKPKWVHASCSASYHLDLPFCNLARIGLALFGFAPELRSALSLETQICSIKTCKKGETIGYDRVFRVEKENVRIGVVPFGYHDGLHRLYSGKISLFIRGKEAPLVGNTCMDFSLIDLSAIPEAKIGDKAVIFNAEHPPESLAKKSCTEVRELLSCLGPRVNRIFINQISGINDERLSKLMGTIKENTHP